MEKIEGVSEGDLEDIKSLLNFRGWEVLMRIHKENVDNLKERVIQDDEITQETREDLRKWVKYLEYFSDLPQKIIESAEEPISNPLKLDPYYRVGNNIGNEENGK